MIVGGSAQRTAAALGDVDAVAPGAARRRASPHGHQPGFVYQGDVWAVGAAVHATLGILLAPARDDAD